MVRSVGQARGSQGGRTCCVSRCVWRDCVCVVSFSLQLCVYVSAYVCVCVCGDACHTKIFSHLNFERETLKCNNNNNKDNNVSDNSKNKNNRNNHLHLSPFQQRTQCCRHSQATQKLSQSCTTSCAWAGSGSGSGSGYDIECTGHCNEWVVLWVRSGSVEPSTAQFSLSHSPCLALSVAQPTATCLIGVC